MTASAAEFAPLIPERRMTLPLLDEVRIAPSYLLNGLNTNYLPPDVDMGALIVHGVRAHVHERTDDLAQRYNRVVDLDDVDLISSELLTNAQVHGGGLVAASVGITASRRSIVVSVEDCNKAWLHPEDAAERADSEHLREHQRGLILTEVLARSCGYSKVRGASNMIVGKIVWATFPAAAHRRRSHAHSGAVTSHQHNSIAAAA
jgi:anti-sigma regulatory factor (Ser/Thr protein kinase)